MQDLTDYTLGHALDDITAHGVNRLFGTVAFGIALDNRLLGRMMRSHAPSL